MTSSIREWLNLLVRWFHVFAGIMWIGQTYYFTWLDGQFGQLERQAAAQGKVPAIWMVHSGGFYTVGKQKTLGVSAEQVRWFRWEALMTWLAGMVLLILVFSEIPKNITRKNYLWLHFLPVICSGFFICAPKRVLW